MDGKKPIHSAYNNLKNPFLTIKHITNFNLLNYKTRSQKFSFPRTIKIIRKRIFKRGKAEDEQERSLLSAYNQNSESNNKNSIKKYLIENDINKIIKSKYFKKENFPNSKLNIRIVNRQRKTLPEHSFNLSKCYFPELKTMKKKKKKRSYNYNVSKPYDTKYVKSQKSSYEKSGLYQTSFFYGNTLYYKKPSISSEEPTFNDSKMTKCNLMDIKYDVDKKVKLIKNDKFNMKKIINAINSFLIPNDKTFENLAKLINSRITNREKTKEIEDNFYINQNLKPNKFKIIKELYKDIINKIYRQMMTKGIKYNTKIKKEDIKTEYKNEIYNLLVYLEKIRKNKINYNNKYKFGDTKQLKNLKLNSQKTIKKNRSCEYPFFHFYNFDEVSLEINKQNSEKDKFIKTIYNDLINSIDNEIIPKIKYVNEFTKRYLEEQKYKDLINKENEMFLNNFYNRLMYCINNINLQQALNNNITNNELIKGDIEKIFLSSADQNFFNLPFPISNFINNNNIFYNNIIMNKKFKRTLSNFHNKKNSSSNTINRFGIKTNSKNSETLNEKDSKDNTLFLDHLRNKINKKTNKNNDISSYIDNRSITKNEQLPEQQVNSLYSLDKETNNKDNNNKKTFSEIESRIKELFDYGFGQRKGKKKKKIKNMNNNNIDNNNINNNANNDEMNYLEKNSSLSVSSDFSSSDENNNNNNEIYKRNNSINGNEKREKNYFRNKKRQNSMSYLKNLKNKKNEILSINNRKNYDRSRKKYDPKLLNKILKKNKYSLERNEKRVPPSENYLQLFFKYNDNNSSGFHNKFEKIFKKKKFVKKKAHKEMTFKDFLMKAKEEEKKRKEEEKEEEEEKEKKEEKKEEKDEKNEKNEVREKKNKIWENKFNSFKDYISKMKQMNSDQFMFDTFKFIQDEE